MGSYQYDNERYDKILLKGKKGWLKAPRAIAERLGITVAQYIREAVMQRVEHDIAYSSGGYHLSSDEEQIQDTLNKIQKGEEQ